MAAGLLKHTRSSEAMLMLGLLQQPIRAASPFHPNGYSTRLIIATLMALNDTSVPTVTFRSTSVVNKLISKQLLSFQ